MLGETREQSELSWWGQRLSVCSQELKRPLRLCSQALCHSDNIFSSIYGISFNLYILMGVLVLLRMNIA